MSMARLLVGDVFERMAELPDASVDLVLTSPPFLALRSYLPADHPDKAKEIGSEPTPAAFLDTLLALTAEWRRVLAPHGSICVELGDTYAGSGGAGGDYDNPQSREGQPKFTGSALADRKNKVLNAAGQRMQQGRGWPLSKSLCGIPHLYHLSLAYGRNLLTGEPSPAGSWRVRNVVAWCRPNPPVGALGDKFRPGTSYMTVACVSGQRYFDLDAVRTASPWAEHHEKYQQDRYAETRKYKRGQGAGAVDGVQNPAGAPPLDWWEIPTQPYAGAHYATWPAALCERPIKAMCPQRVCTTCGKPSTRIVEHLGETRRLAPPSLSDFADGLEVAMRRAQMTHREVAAACGVDEAQIRHYLGKTGKANHSLPSLGMWEQLVVLLPFDWDIRQAMEPVPPEYETADRGNRQVNGRLSGGAHEGDLPKRVATGWSDCGHNSWRNGLVLDPFAGSGTTLAVATGHGRDAIGIDLDPRNAQLCSERVGMFLEIDEPEAVA